MNSQLPAKRPLLCLITEGKLTDENFQNLRDAVIEKAVNAVDQGVHLVQLREKSLSTRRLLELSKVLRHACDATLLVNDRFDVALAADLDGVHLTETSIPTAAVRKVVGDRLVIGRSCHDIGGLKEAESGGADFAVLGPVFSTPGKDREIGLKRFREVCTHAPDLPILALGGVNAENIGEVLEAGAAGIAAIRFLNDAHALANLKLQ